MAGNQGLMLRHIKRSTIVRRALRLKRAWILMRGGWTPSVSRGKLREIPAVLYICIRSAPYFFLSCRGRRNRGYTLGSEIKFSRKRTLPSYEQENKGSKFIKCTNFAKILCINWNKKRSYSKKNNVNQKISNNYVYIASEDIKFDFSDTFFFDNFYS